MGVSHSPIFFGFLRQINIAYRLSTAAYRNWDQWPYLPIISAICYNALFAVTAQCASIWVAKRVRWIPPRLKTEGSKARLGSRNEELI